MATTLQQFPIYIPTKGRHGSMLTSKALTQMRVRHLLVVEPQQVDDYTKAIEQWNLLAELLPLDLTYKARYELCDEHGLSKSTGPGPARNFAWDHALSQGHAWHWVMDDNIRSFRRQNHNERVKVTSSGYFAAMEHFAVRYANLAMCGPHYQMFAKSRVAWAPLKLNTRVYSCNLIRNDVPFRWRGRYNEDTILSLDMLKAGWCTVQFLALLQEKMPTQTLKGGNTAEFYEVEGTLRPGSRYTDTGTLAKSQMQVHEHPDCSRLSWRFGRWHHHVDYSGFVQQLKLRAGVELDDAPNEFGMLLMPKAQALAHECLQTRST
jgi:hypothetical protein